MFLLLLPISISWHRFLLLWGNLWLWPCIQISSEVDLPCASHQHDGFLLHVVVPPLLLFHTLLLLLLLFLRCSLFAFADRFHPRVHVVADCLQFAQLLLGLHADLRTILLVETDAV